MKLDTPLTGAALRENLEHFTEAIHKFVMKRLGRTRDLEDIAQDVHARLLKIDPSTQVENPVGYVHAVTHNVISDRAKNGANRLNDGAVPLETLTASELEEQSSLNVEDSSDRLIDQQQIELALASLPAERAKVVICLKVHGMSYEQTAEHLGLTLGQVRHHIASANKLLKNFQRDR